MALVARTADVSITTVSHVVNRTRPVAPATERAVLAAMAEVGYVGPRRASQASGAMTVGVAMSAMTNPYFGAVVQAMDRRASSQGYSLLLADTHDEPGEESRAMHELLRRGVAGVVLAPSEDPGGALAAAAAQGVPVVLVDRLLPLDLDQVGSENREATASLAEHLASVGHERIALVRGRTGLATSDERAEGFRLGMRRAGLVVDETLVVEGDSDDETAEQAVRSLWSRRDRPTALVVGNNRMTIGVVRTLRALDVDVPRDVALAVYDDFEWADCFSPRLTAIAQPTGAIGAQAVDLLTSRLGDLSLPARVVQMRPTFMHRDSCGCRVTA